MKKIVRILTGLAVAVPLFAGLHPSAMAAQIQNEDIVHYAENFVGTPYRWGGTTPSGFDCSGFTDYVYKHFNIQLPRTAQEQFNEGQVISRSQLLPGDLVFFNTYATGATHVGIYAGNNKFVDAASNGVTISNLSLSYWETRYLGARRYIRADLEQVKSSTRLLPMKKGQIGQVNIIKGIKLWKRVNGKLVYVRGLYPGSMYRVYSKDNKFGGQFDLGQGLYVTNMKGYVDYISE